MNPITDPIYTQLDLGHFPQGQLSRAWIQLATNGLGLPLLAPVLVARGPVDGPILGLTAAIHGDELNGIRVIQRLMHQLTVKELKGTVIGVPILNIPGALRHQRLYLDDKDLNRIMPGKAHGSESEAYAFAILERIIKSFDYLIDLHTASFGRINSYYIRANLNVPEVAEMARLQQAQIVLNVPSQDGTLRGAAMELGIPAITVEVGDPNRFQKGLIRSSMTGIFNSLSHLGILDEAIEEGEYETIYCESSQWIYADEGGILEVLPPLVDRIKQGEKLAVVRDIFGDILNTYYAPEDGIVIGKSVMPIGASGSRILHLGRPKQEKVL